MSFERDGAQLFVQAARRCMSMLMCAIAAMGDPRPGRRVATEPTLEPMLDGCGPIGAIASVLIGMKSRPVRVVLFDKTERTNWALGWHQDRTIVVQERIDAPGYGAWTMKDGSLHVAPPFALLARMVTLRIHIDAVPATNAPLLIAPGSHRVGQVAVPDIEQYVVRHGQYACLAEAGDIWAYATPILHASDRAAIPGRRRVLQIDYAAGPLPHGVRWRGIGQDRV